MKSTSTCRILSAPESGAALLRGIERMTSLLRPTLGPVGGVVVIAGPTATSTPEVLSDAAVIARRTIQIEDPFEDMGAMIVRQAAWKVHEAVGDGSATAAVLCSEMVRHAYAYSAAGGNAMEIRSGIERGVQVAVRVLRDQSREVRLPEELEATLMGTAREGVLANMVAEIVEAVGVDGAIRVEDSSSAATAYDYVQGSRWESGSLSYVLIPDGRQEVLLSSPRILIVDSKLSAEQLLPVIELCVSEGERSLLVVAPSLSDSALALLLRNRERGVLAGAMAVKAPAQGKQQEDLLEDFAVIVGGRYIHTAAGEGTRGIALDDLGTARQAWVTRQTFGVLGGGGERATIRRRVTEARGQLAGLAHDSATRRHVEGRIASLVGSSAIIRVGGSTSSEQKERRSRVESSIRLARSALQGGAVPGGGAAFVGCVPALQQLAGEVRGDQAFGVQALMKALFAPIECIARNSGVDPAVIAHRAREACPNETFDATRNAWVEPWQAGIVDPLPVVVYALEASASAAVMALTTDVLVRRRVPEVRTEP